MRRRPPSPVALTLLALSLASPGSVHAQLVAATGRIDEEFTRILSVRELRDGRVLIADDQDKRLVVAELPSGAVRLIGRTGRGPGEYEQPGRLIAAGGDTTLMQDGGNTRRWLVLAGDSVVATTAPDHPVIVATAGSLGGADARGHVLARRPAPLADIGGGRRRTTSSLVRVEFATGRSDTIATVRGITIESQSRGAPPTQTIASYQVTGAPADLSAMFPDGWVAIARSEPYRVEWLAPGGDLVAGAPIEEARVRFTDEEKRFWHDALLRDAGSDRPFDYSTAPFTEFVASFRGPALPTPDGMLLVHRERSRAAPGNDYDVIDRRGARVRTIRLPWTERIVGFGAASVYVSAKDDDGIERLRRHPWPPSAAR
jgi:hypothetical protein